ncbi:hypothetical protein F4778DRAFT_795415 [Xylariomycetidae sp. FL2044]|nr:hypothetical protein F4778DRAFT_795415 [Xylariomycetidae sp. FL2044]
MPSPSPSLPPSIKLYTAPHSLLQSRLRPSSSSTSTSPSPRSPWPPDENGRYAAAAADGTLSHAEYVATVAPDGLRAGARRTSTAPVVITEKSPAILSMIARLAASESGSGSHEQKEEEALGLLGRTDLEKGPGHHAYLRPYRFVDKGHENDDDSDVYRLIREKEGGKRNRGVSREDRGALS